MRRAASRAATSTFVASRVRPPTSGMKSVQNLVLGCARGQERLREIAVGVNRVNEGRVMVVGTVLSFNRDDAECTHHGMHVRARTARHEPVAWIRLESARQLAHRLRRIVLRIQRYR